MCVCVCERERERERREREREERKTKPCTFFTLSDFVCKDPADCGDLPKDCKNRWDKKIRCRSHFQVKKNPKLSSAPIQLCLIIFCVRFAAQAGAKPLPDALTTWTVRKDRQDYFLYKCIKLRSLFVHKNHSAKLSQLCKRRLCATISCSEDTDCPPKSHCDKEKLSCSSKDQALGLEFHIQRGPLFKDLKIISKKPSVVAPVQSAAGARSARTTLASLRAEADAREA